MADLDSTAHTSSGGAGDSGALGASGAALSSTAEEASEQSLSSAAARTPARPLLELESVSFAYKQAEEIASATSSALPRTQYALKNLSVCIREGEFVGVIGPSGAGKTTFASILTGAIPHHFQGELSGSVRICSRPTQDLSLTDISCVIGSIVQDIDAQMVASTVEDELLFGLENFSVPRAEVLERMDEALEMVGLSRYRFREIDTLSGGQKQKVAIAAILALRPHVMVLDEPTSALDPQNTRQIFSILSRLNKEFGITIVVIEQKVALLAEFCKRLMVFHAGELVLDDTVEKALDRIDILDEVGVCYPRTIRLLHRIKDPMVEYLKSHADECQPAPEASPASEFAHEHPAAPARALISRSAQAVNASSASATFAQLVDALSAAPSEMSSFVAEHLADSYAQEARSPREVSKGAVKPIDPHPVLELSKVSFSYGDDSYCLSDINFSAYAGELIALVGQNGAGKTTITKLINGLLRPRAGQISIAQAPSNTLLTSDIARFVSTLFQNPDRQLSKATILEEVAFSLELLGEEKTRACARAQKVIAELGLSPDESPFLLSRGQRQMVALAATIVTEPKILLLDEPTSGLDFNECMRVMHIVEKLRQNGCLVIMVCHDMEVVVDFATRLIVLSEGKLLFDGGVKHVFFDSALCDAASLYPPLLARMAADLDASRYAAFRECMTISEFERELIAVLARARARTEEVRG